MPAGSECRRPALGAAGLGAVAGRRFAGAAAALALLFAWITSNGETLLFGVIQDIIGEQVRHAGLTDPQAIGSFVARRTTSFYSDLFFWTNAGAAVMQIVLLGLGRAGGLGVLLVLVSLAVALSSSIMALAPALGLIKMVKALENATSLSAGTTATQLLWLPVDMPGKEATKRTVDTLVTRLGDALAAVSIHVGLTAAGASVHSLYQINLVLIALWVVAACVAVRERQRLAAAGRGRVRSRRPAGAIAGGIGTALWPAAAAALAAARRTTAAALRAPIGTPLGTLARRVLGPEPRFGSGRLRPAGALPAFAFVPRLAAAPPC